MKYLLALVVALFLAAPAPAQVSVQVGPGWRRPPFRYPFPTRFAFDPRFVRPYYNPYLFADPFAFDPFADPFFAYRRPFVRPWWWYGRWW